MHFFILIKKLKGLFQNIRGISKLFDLVMCNIKTQKTIKHFGNNFGPRTPKQDNL